MDAFGPALAGADDVVLTDIYAAGEDPIPGVTLEALAAAVRRSVTGAGATSCRRSTRSCRALVARSRRPGDRRDHARRRLDRHACADRLIAALRREEAA